MLDEEVYLCSERTMYQVPVQERRAQRTHPDKKPELMATSGCSGRSGANVDGSLTFQGQAKTFCRSFFRWYNAEHRHGGISMLPPEQVHFGNADQVIAGTLMGRSRLRHLVEVDDRSLARPRKANVHREHLGRPLSGRTRLVSRKHPRRRRERE